MLALIAHRFGLSGGPGEAVPLDDVKREMSASGLGLDIDSVLKMDNPVLWLVEQAHFSDKALETFTDIIMHSDAAEEMKRSFLNDSISYLDSRGCFSFLLQSYYSSIG